MSEDINVESIRKGDRVKVSLHGLPESDWLEVVSVGVLGKPKVILPDGLAWTTYPGEITAHEPAAPALDAKVIATGCSRPQYGVLNDGGYTFEDGEWEPADVVSKWAVTVVVDRDGNQPGRARYGAAYGIQAMRERDAARADLAAFRAKVAEVRDFLSSRAVERLRYDLSFDRGAAYAGRDAADRLSAILDGTDQ